jgi:hypothetical protein
VMARLGCAWTRATCSRPAEVRIGAAFKAVVDDYDRVVAPTGCARST